MHICINIAFHAEMLQIPSQSTLAPWALYVDSCFAAELPLTVIAKLLIDIQ